MPSIQVLDEETIDKIAAGEVVERPASVVKELVENAIDAKATAVTIEIKDGGISLIRITDNGQGIPKEQVSTAFLRHATSKLRSMEDLICISSLGFRGEALSSIAAVAQVEMITKTPSELLGVKYVIEGSKEKSIEEVGAPDGTTFVVKNLFYNTPARQKFLKAPQTEAAYISTFVERLALSHPDISFQFIVNNQPKLHTNGNTRLKDIIYHIFGREITAGVLPIHAEKEWIRVEGFIGKPFISRGNRNFETYFINGRYIKSNLIMKSIEEAYKPFLMKHQYPFTVLQISVDSELIDVNVHPAKMEIRFQKGEEIYKELMTSIQDALEHKDMVPEVPAGEERKNRKAEEKLLVRAPEPFEKKRIASQTGKQETQKAEDIEICHQTEPVSVENPDKTEKIREIDKTEETDKGKERNLTEEIKQSDKGNKRNQTEEIKETGKTVETEQKPGLSRSKDRAKECYEQLTLAESGAYHTDFIKEAKRNNYTLIGQLFDTYWLVQAEQELFIIDQHAAHEKVLYEKMMQELKEHEFTSQQISPPLVITMTMQEQELFLKYKEQFEQAGFEIHEFGGREYAVSAIPANLYSLNQKELFLEMLDRLSHDTGKNTPELILEKIASMSCKAAVKGSQRLSSAEAKSLIEDLMELENPYNCPHGRPTIIAMSKTEIEKKFKRIV